jgi:hypothetical protein
VDRGVLDDRAGPGTFANTVRLIGAQRHERGPRRFPDVIAEPERASRNDPGADAADNTRANPQAHPQAHARADPVAVTKAAPCVPTD